MVPASGASAAARDEIGRICSRERRAVLAQLVRHAGGSIARAEDALQEAFIAAIVSWPSAGMPTSPQAWLVGVAKHKLADDTRRHRTREKYDGQLIDAGLLGAGRAELPAPQEAIRDDELRLMFVCCHPALSVDAQVALTLHTVAGLATHQIARSFLCPVATMAQRLVRAKAKIELAKIPYEIPGAHELPLRLEAVLSTIYLVFNEGYASTDGDQWLRDDLCKQALTLGEHVMSLMATMREALQASAAGLLALMLCHDARRRARLDDHGDLVLLEDQDRSRWHQPQIARAAQLVEFSLRRGASYYGIQAAIAALHCQAKTAAETDWPQILGLYDALIARYATPVGQLNRAVAVAQVQGPAAALDALVPLATELDAYHLYHSTVAAMHRKLAGALQDTAHQATHRAAASAAYQRALALATCTVEQRFLAKQLAAMVAPATA